MKNRNRKRDLARKMMLKEEVRDNVPVYNSVAWNRRKEAIKNKIKKNG